MQADHRERTAIEGVSLPCSLADLSGQAATQSGDEEGQMSVGISFDLHWNDHQCKGTRSKSPSDGFKVPRRRW